MGQEWTPSPDKQRHLGKASSRPGKAPMRRHPVCFLLAVTTTEENTLKALVLA